MVLAIILLTFWGPGRFYFVVCSKRPEAGQASANISSVPYRGGWGRDLGRKQGDCKFFATELFHTQV